MVSLLLLLTINNNDIIIIINIYVFVIEIFITIDSRNIINAIYAAVRCLW